MRLELKNDLIFKDGAPLPYFPKVKVFAIGPYRETELTHCVMADDVTGEYERFVTGADGRAVYFPEIDGAKTERGTARLRIELTP